MSEDLGRVAPRRPILLQTRFEPTPIWHWIGRKWVVILYFRPFDVSVGLQFMWGGAAVMVWPLLLAVCNHTKMPSGPVQGGQHD